MNEIFFKVRNKKRHYLHFDDKYSASFLFNYICNPNNINQHSFYPFIHYQIGEKKYRKASRLLRNFQFLPFTSRYSSVYLSFNHFTRQGKNVLHYKAKIRDINFPSHLDGNIYAYYSHLLTAPYEQFLLQYELQGHVLAFRKVYKISENIKTSQCNIHFCKTVFDEIRERQTCVVLCFDIKKFFDNLNHEILKEKWCELLGVQRLPLDHFKVYKSLTQYASVDKISLYNALAISLHNRRPKKNGMRLTRLCESNEFREKVKKNNLINVNKTGVGIPQGSPLSGMLSNIYMMAFDRAVHQFMREINGNYYRYCDDILCIGTIENEIEIRSFIERQIALLKLDIHSKKTQRVNFINGKVAIEEASISFSNPAKLQYLGLTFDGSKVALREMGISKYHYKMRKAIRMRVSHFKNLRADKKLSANTMYMRKLHTRYTYIGKRNYLSYVFKVAKIHDSKNVKRQMSGHLNVFNNYLSKKLN